MCEGLGRGCVQRAVQTEAPAGSCHSEHAGTLHQPDLVSSDGGFVISTFLVSPYSPRFPFHCWACGRRPISPDSSMWCPPKPLSPVSCSMRPTCPCRNCPHHHLRGRAKPPLTGENVGLLFKETPMSGPVCQPSTRSRSRKRLGGRRPWPPEGPSSPAGAVPLAPVLIFKPHSMMMNKLIYFLPLLNIRTNKK